MLSPGFPWEPIGSSSLIASIAGDAGVGHEDLHRSQRFGHAEEPPEVHFLRHVAAHGQSLDARGHRAGRGLVQVRNHHLEVGKNAGKLGSACGTGDYGMEYCVCWLMMMVCWLILSNKFVQISHVSVEHLDVKPLQGAQMWLSVANKNGQW